MKYHGLVGKVYSCHYTLLCVTHLSEKRQIRGRLAHTHICCPSFAALSCIILCYQDKIVCLLGIVTRSLYIPPKVLNM